MVPPSPDWLMSLRGLRKGECILPIKPKYYCKRPGCPELVESGTSYCQKHKLSNSRQIDQRRGTANERGYTYLWQRIRCGHLIENSLCVICRSHGIIRRAEHVHHIRPIVDGGGHEPQNLMSLCLECHSRLHMQNTNEKRVSV